MRGMGGKALWVGLLVAFFSLSRGMAGAYTAYAADGAAIWFNPAGLPLLEPRLLQGSLSLIQRRTLEIQGAIVSDGPDGVGGED